VHEKIIPTAAEHSNTTFLIFNPSVLQYLLWVRARLGLIEVWNRAQELFATEISKVPNVHYFDFYAASEIQSDCRRFMDIAHFDPATGDQLVRWMNAGTFEPGPVIVVPRSYFAPGFWTVPLKGRT
jgi:hypothetical protein